MTDPSITTFAAPWRLAALWRSLCGTGLIIIPEPSDWKSNRSAVAEAPCSAARKSAHGEAAPHPSPPAATALVQCCHSTDSPSPSKRPSVPHTGGTPLCSEGCPIAARELRDPTPPQHLGHSLKAEASAVAAPFKTQFAPDDPSLRASTLGNGETRWKIQNLPTGVHPGPPGINPRARGSSAVAHRVQPR